MKHLVQNDVKNIQIPSLLHEMQIYLICHFQHAVKPYVDPHCQYSPVYQRVGL